MNIEEFIQQYTTNDIKNLEHQDPQFLALKKSRKNISNKSTSNKNLFIFLGLQCALVSYQISGGGELWRGEFSQKISQDRQILQQFWQNNKSNNSRRYKFLTKSNYNKRIYNIKTTRLQKFDIILDYTKDFSQYKNNMTALQTIIGQIMKVDKQSKTIVFAIKILGYIYQITSETKINYPIYPMSISIPIDSRITKIYLNSAPSIKGKSRNKKKNHTQIQKYFDNLSQKYKIPPLHIDSILWLDYWENFIK